jgi:hypothetical protein
MVGIALTRSRDARIAAMSPPPARATCAYRKSNPSILVVQSAQDRVTENASGCLDGA